MNPKIPKINLSGIQRVSPEPLRQRLKTFRHTRDDVANAKVRLQALEKEVNDFLEKIDPDDQKSLQMVSAKKLQLEILPRMIAKVERQLEEDMAPALLAEADKFRSGLVRFYDEVHGVFANTYAEMFRRYFSDRVNGLNGEQTDRAREIAVQTDDCLEVIARKNEAEFVRLPFAWTRSNNPSSYDEALCGAADALLTLAERK